VGYVCISHSRKNIKSRCEYYGSRTTGILRNPDKGLISFDSRTSRVIRFYRFNFGHQLPLTHATNSRPFVLRDIICLFKYSLLCFNLSNFPHRNLLFPLKLAFHYSLWLCVIHMKYLSIRNSYLFQLPLLLPFLYTQTKLLAIKYYLLSFISKS